MNRRPQGVLAGMLAVGIAFTCALTLGFRLRKYFPSVSDDVYGGAVAIVVVGVAAGGTWLLRPREKRAGMSDHAEWPVGENGRHTGYEIRFEDFGRLITDESSRAVIAPLLRAWYGYEIHAEGPSTVVRSEQGEAINLRELHHRIQIDDAKQYTIYQRAMDLWR